MRTRAIFLLPLLLATCRCPAGVLDNIRSEVRDSSSSDSSDRDRDKDRDQKRKKNRDRSRTSFDEDGNSFAGEVLGSLLGPSIATVGSAAVYGVTSPFWVPRQFVEGDMEGFDAWFSKAPYRSSAGSMVLEEFETSKAWFAELQIDYGIGSDDVETTAFRFRSDFARRFGIDTEAFFLREDVPLGTDRLQHGDVNLTYRFAQNEKWQFRTGLGYNWLHDDAGTDHGINFTYSVDWFPRDPLFTSTTLDLGTIGRSSRVHLRAVIGATRNGFGIFTGYDGLRIGDAKIHSWVNGIEYRW